MVLENWDRDPDTRDFWRRWWIGSRDGKPLDWELQKRVALIPPEEWKINDPAHIARLIREIEAGFAQARIDNAERIELNTDTGRLRLVPDSALPADISALARTNIAAHDPRTREVLARRAEMNDEGTFFVVREQTLALADAVAAQAEGELATALPEDAENETNPDAHPEERRDSAFRLTGRMIRVAIVGGVLGLGAIGAAGDGVKHLMWLAQRSEWQPFLDAVWRFLGMG